MTHYNRLRVAYGSVLAIAFALGTSAFADTVKVEGLIKLRNGNAMLVQTSDSTNVTVLLNDDTAVSRPEGALKVRSKEMPMTDLIPGLAVKVQGNYNEQHQLVATSIKFKSSDLKRAQSIQAGLHESQEALKKQQEELKAHNEALQAQQSQLAEQKAKIAANKKAIEEAVARFGQLDDYYIFDEVTVYFGNGKIKVDPKYVPQLLALADKARNVEGYMIEVTGHASSQGSVAVNQRLSEDRAENVTNILLQQGHVPLTRMLAPGAMGESHQAGNDKTAAGQAASRRVVVRVLQNKAIAGL
ncbi:MAG: OmpA family protein [Acidobacteriia bacterium]|nr:OmpA family protein [Terriglobia bacterium]